ncbi:MAG: nitroreductase family protein [Desulfatibacillaceae bacterium]
MVLEKLRHRNLPPTVFARFAVDEEKCTGCGRCVRTCPIQLLEMANGHPSPNQRYDHFRCITCQNCAVACKEQAIRIEGDYRVTDGYWKNDHLFAGPKTMPEPLAEHAGKPFEEYEDQLTETERVIYRRRSIRLYKKKAVPREVVERIIEAGRFAPSAGNNQPWKFIAIQNRSVIDEINARCKKSLRIMPYLSLPHQWMDKTTPGNPTASFTRWQKALLPLLVGLKPGEFEPRVRGGINAVTADPGYDIFFGAPSLVIILADKRGIGDIELDVGICAQNMVLAAHAMGLGTCYVGLVKALNVHPGYKKSLGIEEPFRIITSFTLGYPRGTIDKPVAREQARVHWVE